jgi:hypothetical protein
VSGNDCATISPTTCTSGTTELTLTGISAGTNCFKANYDGQTAANLNVISFEEQRLSVGIYRIYDSRSHSAADIGGPSSSFVEATMDDVFRQCGVEFSVTDYGGVDVSYDTNLDGKMQDFERRAFNFGAHNWQGDVLVFLFNESGISYPEDPSFMIRGIKFDVSGSSCRGGFLFVNGPDGLGSGELSAMAAAHETGHVLGIASCCSDYEGHDTGPVPAGTSALMKSGAPAGGVLPTTIGEWIRQEDWKEANRAAKEEL